VVDPFLQIGAGMNMAAPMTEHAEPVLLGFHPLAGAGVNVSLGAMFVRANIQYQGVSFAVPASDLGPYETGAYRVLLSAGLLLP
jgi:hypothetical protein